MFFFQFFDGSPQFVQLFSLLSEFLNLQIGSVIVSREFQTLEILALFPSWSEGFQGRLGSIHLPNFVQDDRLDSDPAGVLPENLGGQFQRGAVFGKSEERKKILSEASDMEQSLQGTLTGDIVTT